MPEDMHTVTAPTPVPCHTQSQTAAMLSSCVPQGRRCLREHSSSFYCLGLNPGLTLAVTLEKLGNVSLSGSTNTNLRDLYDSEVSKDVENLHSSAEQSVWEGKWVLPSPDHQHGFVTVDHLLGKAHKQLIYIVRLLTVEDCWFKFHFY